MAAGGVALLADKATGPWIVPAIIAAGVLGGMAWAGITALLRDRFNANEILVSLMLVYVADMVLSYLVFGPWKDPQGYNFPQTKTFETVTQIPRLMSGSRVSIGVLIALAGAAALWIFLFRTYAGFAQQVGGLAPSAARYAGFSSRKACGWLSRIYSPAATRNPAVPNAGSQITSSGVGRIISTMVWMMWRGVRNCPLVPALAILPSIYS